MEAGVPSGYLVGPNAGARLTAVDVNRIVGRAVEQANSTRAAIRLPLGSATRMVIAVADLDGTLLAVYRMPDATVFSIDGAATKARNVIHFSSPSRNPGDMPGFPLGFSMTSGTIGFGAMPLFPPGIDGTAPVGGLGVSGDGVEQDDLVTAAGAGCPGCPSSFVAPLEIRADRVILGGVRLPYLKFPRNPEVP